MKISIRGGHNPGVPGANGLVNEVTEDRKYYKSVIKYLQTLGHEVLDVTPGNTFSSAQDLTYGVSKANEFKADLMVSCHVNAGGGQGAEVIYISNKGKEYAEKVVNAIASLGFHNRGAKADTRGLYELRHSNMPCIIVEPFFLDTQSDVDLYLHVGYDRLGEAIAEAISGKMIEIEPVKPVAVPQPAPAPADPNLADYGMPATELQWKLNWRGYGVAQTGRWDVQTQAAVLRFQQDAKLHPTSYLNVETAKALNNYDFKVHKVSVEGLDIKTASKVVEILKNNGYNPAMD